MSQVCRATQMDGSWWKVLTKHGPLEKGMANHLGILALRIPWTVQKGKKDRTLKKKLPRSIGAKYATGAQWRNNSRKNEGMKPKQKQHPVVDVMGDVSKVQCCKDQYCIGTWNIRSMNQGIGSGQTGDGKSEHQHFKNQWTKMDWNGWI